MGGMCQPPGLHRWGRLSTMWSPGFLKCSRRHQATKTSFRFGWRSHTYFLLAEGHPWWVIVPKYRHKPLLFPCHPSQCEFCLASEASQYPTHTPSPPLLLVLAKVLGSWANPFCLLFVKSMYMQQKPRSTLYWLLPINLAGHKKLPWNTIQGHKSLRGRENLMGNKILSFHLFPCLKDWLSNQLWTLMRVGR